MMFLYILDLESVITSKVFVDEFENFPGRFVVCARFSKLCEEDVVQKVSSLVKLWVALVRIVIFGVVFGEVLKVVIERRRTHDWFQGGFRVPERHRSKKHHVVQQLFLCNLYEPS
jgi:hypothetical protein